MIPTSNTKKRKTEKDRFKGNIFQGIKNMLAPVIPKHTEAQ